MKDAILVFTANDHPLTERVIRYHKKLGFKLLHRNAEVWEGNVMPVKGVAVESLDSPVFTFRLWEQVEEGGSFDVVEQVRTLADVYQEAGIPVRVLKPRVRKDVMVVDLDAEEVAKEEKQKAIPSFPKPTIMSKPVKAKSKAKAKSK